MTDGWTSPLRAAWSWKPVGRTAANAVVWPASAWASLPSIGRLFGPVADGRGDGRADQQQGGQQRAPRQPSRDGATPVPPDPPQPCRLYSTSDTATTSARETRCAQSTPVPGGQSRGLPGRSASPAYNALAVTPPLPDLILYARPGCSLCDETRAALGDPARRSRGSRPPGPAPASSATSTPTTDWQRQFAFTIPVVELGERRLELATSPARLRRLLADGLDGAPGAPA